MYFTQKESVSEYLAAGTSCSAPLVLNSFLFNTTFAEQNVVQQHRSLNKELFSRRPGSVFSRQCRGSESVPLSDILFSMRGAEQDVVQHPWR